MNTRKYLFLVSFFCLIFALFFLFIPGCTEEECNLEQDEVCSELYGSCIDEDGSLDSICGDCFDGYLSCLESVGCLYGLTNADCDFPTE